MDGRFGQGQQWISGFLSGYNAFVDTNGDVIGGRTDREGVNAWVDQYCREHPTDEMVYAVTHFIGFIKQRSK
jgi:hypothetical protein